MTYHLSLQMVNELKRQRDSTGPLPPTANGPTLVSVPPRESTPYYVHPTKDIQHFLLSINGPLALWFQQIIASTPNGELGADRQKLRLLVNLLRQVSYSGSNIKRHSILYKEMYE